MHRIRLLALLTSGFAFATAPIDAQQRDTPPRTAAALAVATYNAERTMRVTGVLEVTADQRVDGDVAVLNGPVRVAGRIAGTLAAINADVQLSPGAVLGGLVVVGGTISGQEQATIATEVMRQPELLRYHLAEQRLVPEAEPTYDEAWWKRRARRKPVPDDRSWSDFTFTSAHTYNRVEGLPILLGPRIRQNTEWGRFTLDAFGVVRTAGPVRWDRGTLGHDVTGELQLGRKAGVGVGGRTFDIVDAVEDWQYSAEEVGLAAFVLRRDNRDYYRRHGGLGFVRMHAGADADLTFSFGDERWASARDRAPISVFNSDEPWRLNPAMDEGTMHLATTRLRVDTRRRGSALWGGWYLDAQVERGSGTLARDPGLLAVIPRPERVEYTRGFIDARRYTRLAPGTALNLRFVTGGWMSGDRLPTQRRLSVGGPGTLPGYDFRRSWRVDPDPFTCGGSSLPGSPALCDRVMLFQAKYRTDFHVGWVRNDARDDWWRPGFNQHAAFVLFADAGRGWSVGAPDLATTYAKDDVPPLSTFRADVGAGFDFGSLGIYVAKATTTASEPVNVIVRFRHRF
ncbi:MAG: hypothetical protein FJ363_11345 [Gemmatimonadetes bacterium]|nr:hypothetical protein [Gemmatimonadota bacterium]